MTTKNLIGADKVMDVRTLPCSEKHPLLMRTWQELPVGDHFILLNNHDPVALARQFATLWPDTFTWEYLVQGADECRIKITKLKPLAKPAEPVPTNCGEH